MEAGKLRSIIRILKAPADERGAPTQDVSRWVEVRTVPVCGRYAAASCGRPSRRKA